MEKGNMRKKVGRWVDKFIKEEYSRIDTLVIKTGIEINKFVKNKLILTKGSSKPS
jgi:hypothetical protein